MSVVFQPHPKGLKENLALIISEFGETLQLATPDGKRIRRRDSPAGIAFFERRPAHETLMATAYNGMRRKYEATAYPLFGATGEMHGVVAVFWEAPGGRNG